MSVPTYEIVLYGDPILAQPTNQVSQFGKPLERIVKRMIPTMRDAVGVGLAANQAGMPLRLAVIEYEPKRNEKAERIPVHAIVNPEILARGTEFDSVEEGCLSCPGIEVPVRRATSITVRYQSIDGEIHEETISGFGARIYQHEIDHLDGFTILDRANGQRALVEAYRANPARFAPKQ